MKPKQTKKISLVALLNTQNEVLLLKRKSDVHCPDVWSFPGGKSETSEEPLQTAKRELKEETGLDGERWLYIANHTHTYTELTLTFSLYICHCPHLAIIQAESDFLWCKIESLHDLDMPDANQMLIQKLLAHLEENTDLHGKDKA